MKRFFFQCFHSAKKCSKLEIKRSHELLVKHAPPQKVVYEWSSAVTRFQPSPQREHTRRFCLLKIRRRLSGLTRFAGKSGVQMVKEGDIRLSSLKKRIHIAASQHEFLIRRRPCGAAAMSTGPRLPASPSGHWGGPISCSHGEALWP